MIERIFFRMLMVFLMVIATITLLAFLLSKSQHAAAEHAWKAMPERAEETVPGSVEGAMAQPTPHFEKGDVFAAVGEPYVYWYRPDDTFTQTLNTGQSGGNNAGMAFDATGNLYVTNYSALTVTKFDISGNLLGTFGSGYGGSPESIVFDCTDNAYVGTATGDNYIRKFNVAGTPVAQFDVETEGHGSDWIDLATDQCTMFYTSEGKRIMRYDVCAGTQLTDFASLPGVQAFALRILPDVGVLVADTEAIYRLDSTGTIVMTYTHPSETRWRNLSLAPDGTSFWGGGWDSSFYRFDIATGDVLTGPINPGFRNLRGLAVFCEPTAASCGCADLAVTKADSQDPVTVGNNLTYTVAVTNQGPTTVTEVTLTDTLPLGVIFGSVTPSQGSCSGTSIITCTFGTVANGDSVIIEIVVTPTAAGVITNTAIVMGNAYDPDTSNNIIAEDTTVSNVVPSVIVENTLTEHNCSAGVVTFTITVTNTGPSELDKIPLYYEYDPYYLDFIASSLTISEPVQHGRLDWCDLTASEPNGFNENLRSGERFTVTLDFGVVRDITRTVTTAVVTGVIDINDNPANEYRDDAQVENVPTAVELLYFWATLRPGAVLLEWETVIEVDNFGFYLLRSASNRLEGAQEIAFVPAAAYGSSGGAAYSFKDLDVQAGSTYSYWLVDIDTSGQRTVHRPITVTITSKADSAYRLYLPVITR